MKHKCYITASNLFTPGTAERILAELGAGPIAKDAQGRIVAHLTQGQIDMWGIKGPAHRLELAPEGELDKSELVAPVSAPVVPEPPFVPSIIVESATGDKKVVPIGKPE